MILTFSDHTFMTEAKGPEQPYMVYHMVVYKSVNS